MSCWIHALSLQMNNQADILFNWFTYLFFVFIHSFIMQQILTAGLCLISHCVFFPIFKLFYCCSITVVCIFSPPLYPTPAKPTSLPCFHPAPWFCSCVLYSSSWKPFSPLSLPHSPLAIVRLFLTSNKSLFKDYSNILKYNFVKKYTQLIFKNSKLKKRPCYGLILQS